MPEPAGQPRRTAGTADEHRVTIAVLVTLGCMSALGPLTSDFYLPGLPDLATDLHTSNAAAQFTLALSLAGIGVGQIFVGPLSDRYGRRKPMLIGLGSYVMMTVLCALAPTIWVLLACRLGQGLAGASAWVLARATVRDLHTGIDAAKVFSHLTLVTGLAPILAPIAGGQLLKVVSWRGIFWVLACIGVAIFTACFVVLKESLSESARAHASRGHQWRQMGQIVRESRFLRYIVASGVQGVVFFTYLSMGPFVFEHAYGLSVQEYSLVFGGSALLGVLGSQVNGALVHRFGPSLLLRWQLGSMMVGSALVLVAFELHAPLPVLLIAVLTVPASAMAAMANTTALVLMPYSRAAGAAAAWQGMCQFLLGAILPPIVSLFASTGVVMGATMTIPAVLGWVAVLTVARPAEEIALLERNADAMEAEFDPGIVA